MRVTLTEASRNPDGIPAGGIYVELGSWSRDEWSQVVVRARGNGSLSRLGVRYNLREGRGTATDFPNPFLQSGTDQDVVADGEVHTYTFDIATAPSTIRQLGLWFFSDASGGRLEVLSIAVRRSDRFSDAPYGLRMIRGRPSIFVHAPAALAYDVRVPENAWLDFGFGTFGSTDSLTFSVRVEKDGLAHVAHEEKWADDGFWAQRSLDLSDFAGQSVRLVLETDASRDGAIAFWREPKLSSDGAARTRARFQPVTTCQTLSAMSLAQTTITRAETVRSGSVGANSDLPPFCRVSGEIRPSNESQILFEVWLPLEIWHGRLTVVGNGGWAGAITFAHGAGIGLSEQLRLGYATASSDTGHRAAAGLDQARFAFEYPERLVDFAYRAQHETTRVAKALVEAFYGRPAERSYYLGQSSGGYQGLMEAQRFPDDFDGILAGMPANNWTRLMAGMMHAISVNAKPGAQITATAAEALHRAVLLECDARDGVSDGVLENPVTCHVDPTSVACEPRAVRSDCLTPEQVSAADAIYRGFRDPISGEQKFPGFTRGSELLWPAVLNPEAPFAIPLSHYKWLIFADSTWDRRTFDFADAEDYSAFLRGEERHANLMNAVDPDLRAFRSRGGKLIHWHGWTDQIIAPQNSVDYFESVLSHFGELRTDRAATLREVQNFYRLFMIPGVAHQGPGADFQTALERWVERGSPPESVEHVRPGGADSRKSHLLCPYPKIAVYDGGGDVNEAGSFRCDAQPG